MKFIVILSPKSTNAKSVSKLPPEEADEGILQQTTNEHIKFIFVIFLVSIGPPLNIAFIKKDETSILITWSPPKDVDKSPEINGYKVSSYYGLIIASFQ